jgi:hypothetical protein
MSCVQVQSLIRLPACEKTSRKLMIFRKVCSTFMLFVNYSFQWTLTHIAAIQITSKLLVPFLNILTIQIKLPKRLIRTEVVVDTANLSPISNYHIHCSWVSYIKVLYLTTEDGFSDVESWKCLFPNTPTVDHQFANCNTSRSKLYHQIDD